MATRVAAEVVVGQARDHGPRASAVHLSARVEALIHVENVVDLQPEVLNGPLALLSLAIQQEPHSRRAIERRLTPGLAHVIQSHELLGGHRTAKAAQLVLKADTISTEPSVFLRKPRTRLTTN